MSYRLIAESRRNDVITKSLNLCTLYCKIDSFLLMIIVSRLIAVESRRKKKREKKKKRKFMFAEFLFRRHFLEVDLEICRCFVFVWFLWSLKLRSEYWLSWKNKEADDLISLRTFRWRKIWLSDWWLSRTSKHFWFVDESRDVRVQRSSAEWSSWSEKKDSHSRTRQSRWTTTKVMCRKCWEWLLQSNDCQSKQYCVSIIDASRWILFQRSRQKQKQKQRQKQDRE